LDVTIIEPRPAWLGSGRAISVSSGRLEQWAEAVSLLSAPENSRSEQLRSKASEPLRREARCGRAL